MHSQWQIKEFVGFGRTRLAFLITVYKKLRYREGTARRAMSVEILSTAAQLKVIQGYRYYLFSTGHMPLRISGLQ